MIIYWKQSLTAMNIKSRYFLPWLSSMPPCLVFNLDTMASLWSHLFICWFASSCNALFHIVFHPFVSITQILVFFFFLIYHIFLCAFLSALNSVYCIKKKNYPFFILTYLKHLFFLKSPYVEFDFPFSVIFAHHIFLQTSNNLNKSSLSLSLEFKNLRHRSSSFDVSIPII